MTSGGNDRRLIEDYLPIQTISKEASREKNLRKRSSRRCSSAGRGSRLAERT